MVASVVGLHFVLEIMVESGVVFATGNVNSTFSALYLLTIVSAALVYRLVGTLVVASLASLSYTFIIWLAHDSVESALDSPYSITALFTGEDTIFYSVFLHLLIFYLVAFISGYLAGRLRDRDRQLADTSRALKKAKLETDDILRHLNSGLLTVDAHGRIIFFNRAAERILGYEEETVKGMSCEEVFAARMPRLAAALRDGFDPNREHPRREIDILSPDGRSIPLGLSTSILTEEGGAFRGVIAIFSDLTQAKALDAKIRAADRLAAVGELSASIAHEIRNPLAAISGSVEVLRDELTLSGENARLMQLIVKESERLSKVLSEFLLYSKIDRPAYNKVELCHIINEVIQLLHHHPSFREEFTVNFESNDSIVYVIGDEDLIKQLLLNLAVNACEAFGQIEGTLTFRIEVAARTVRLFVRDNGPGIRPDDLKRIYQPFFSTKKQGTGLGLAIVHRISTALKLTINVQSRLTQGTTFVIEFRTHQHDSSGMSARSTEIACNSG